MAVHHTKARTILTRYKTADPWFHIKYSMNLYRGCQHQCIYCDSRSSCYRIENFEDIIIKENAIELLQKELKSLKEKNTIGTGSMNDAYMPIEETMGLTRKALEVIVRYKFPLHVITKSDLVVRDIDLIKEISRVHAVVSFSITSANDQLSSIIEPGAPVTSKRFAAMKKLSDAGITTGVTLMPILPHINDTPENITLITEQAKEAGASYILPSFGLTLRDKQKDYFFKKLENFFPEAYREYIKNYKGQYAYMSPNQKELENRLKLLCQKHQINMAIPYYKPEDIIQTKLF
jgi:DNA repair photolyase